MKKLFTTLVAIIAIAQFSYAQWTRSATDTTNIYNLNSGKVGIGTATPLSKLDVNGGVAIGTYAGSAAAPGNGLIISGNVGIGTTTPGTALEVWDSFVSGVPVNDARYQNIVRNSQNQIYLGVENSSGGGIATGSLGGAGVVSSNSPKALQFATNATVAMTILNGGNVGVGTKTPNNLFEIRRDDTSGPELGLTNANAINGNKATIRFQLTSGGVAGASIASIFQNYSTGRSDLTFSTHSGGGFSENMRILGNGKVGIGTTSPDEKLTVKGKIHSEEVRVDLSVPAPDYVFENDYKLPALNDLKSYVDKNHHLPEMPSAKEFAKDGLNLGEINTLLLKKVEELTLYLIEQNKQLKRQTERINKLEKQLPKTNKRK